MSFLVVVLSASANILFRAPVCDTAAAAAADCAMAPRPNAAARAIIASLLDALASILAAEVPAADANAEDEPPTAMRAPDDPVVTPAPAAPPEDWAEPAAWVPAAD